VGRIVFSKEVVPGLFGLYTMKADGSDLRPLSTTTGISLILPVVSPDGHTVAATGYRFASNTPELFLIDLDSSSFDSLPIAKGLRGVSWSPDGQKLVIGCFNSTPPQGEAPASICTINRNGSGFLQLVHSGTDRWWPSWSPDGTEIAFQSDSLLSPSDTAKGRVFSMNIASGQIRRISPDTFPVDRPERSGDGSYIAYYGSPNAAPQRAYLVRDDASGHREISGGNDPIACAVVSPSHTRILLCRNSQIYSSRLDGTDTHPLTTDTLLSVWPAWIPQ
jgi:TolB protein